MRSATFGGLNLLVWTTALILCLGSTLTGQNPATPPAGAAPATSNQPPSASQATPASQSPSSTEQAPAPAMNGSSESDPQSPGTGQEPPIAQEPTANDQAGMFVFKKQVEEVVLHATVMDEQRHLVPYLERSAFTVYEDGLPQTITSFRREDVPVAMGIVIDNSGSMRDKRAAVNRAVMNLIRASNPEDEIFVVNFDKNYYLDQDFTSDVNLLQASLKQVSTRGSTALYDAILASAVHLKNNPRLEKKVLLVITDGQDNMSQQTLQEATRRIQQVNGPMLFAIGLSGYGLQTVGRQALQNLADGTGGVAYFPDSLTQVNDITQTVAHDIRSQYIVAYKPRKQGGRPAYQSIKVEARAPGYGRLTVRTRTGFYQPDNNR
jgi:Ca-activated chloride channel family protein